MSALRNNLIEAIDVAVLGLERAAVIFTAIDALDLGVGGKHFDTLCALRAIGAEDIKDALAQLRAIPTAGEDA